VTSSKAARGRPAREVAQDRGAGVFWIDHARIVDDDATWLRDAQRLTLWNVQVPPGFLARLPKLWWLDLRGGSAPNLEVTRGCTGLRYLAVRHVRGLADLGLLTAHVRLELLALYALAQVREAPSLRRCTDLLRLEVGQMKALSELGPMLEAPRLRELHLQNRVVPSDRDVAAIQGHRSLRAFGWSYADLPARIFEPVMRRILHPEARAMHPEEWFDATGRAH
jgi:hypothetical protein